MKFSGLLVDNGATWRAHRKLLEPSFNTSIVKSVLPIFHEKTSICMNKLEKHAGGAEFNISHTWELLAFDNIMSTSLGVNKDIQMNDENQHLLEVVVM